MQGSVKQGIMTQLDEKDNTFDLAIAFRVIHHAIKIEIQLAMDEIWRILKPGEYFFATLKAFGENIPSSEHLS